MTLQRRQLFAVLLGAVLLLLMLVLGSIGGTVRKPQPP